MDDLINDLLDIAEVIDSLPEGIVFQMLSGSLFREAAEEIDRLSRIVEVHYKREKDLADRLYAALLIVLTQSDDADGFVNSSITKWKEVRRVR